MEALGVIVARGGSKSIPKKSIAPCAGFPLMHYTIEAAKRARSISRLIISTDDAEMAEAARSRGVEVPFVRPDELAQDHTPDLPVFQHALQTLADNEGYRPDMIVHLRPTTPLKKTSDIERGIELLQRTPAAESVRSICEPLHTPFKMYRIDEETGMLNPLLQKEFPDVFSMYEEPYNLPRQMLPPVWRHSGYVDIIRPEVIHRGSMSGRRMLPLKFESWRDVDIDTMHDLEHAAYIINELRAKEREPWS